ncbi:DnaJ-like cysteine-rich domain-containing protein [Bizionia myxarmorum]|uniref:Uncharacterized protein n=1 Tax=Bizionia myxarmorum TaxID=291186 RepID=A0A5D0RCL7_9FLAO|nr:hypothetical protein [Bizionia myxarmorum]TYB78314.1 hypothetical protein ES674_00610 [Bizionia myxarmorum]
MKKLTPNKYDFIANMFTSNDKLRPVLCMPGIIGNLVYATDAYSAIRFSKSLSNLDYSRNLNFPNAESIYPLDKLTEKFTYNVQILMLKIFNCEAIFNNLIEDCYKCHGSGSSECDCCGNDSECLKCDGKGKITKETSFANITLNGPDINIFSNIVQPKFIYRVIQAALILKVEEIELLYNFDKKDNKIIFKVGEIEILIMTKLKE